MQGICLNYKNNVITLYTNVASAASAVEIGNVTIHVKTTLEQHPVDFALKLRCSNSIIAEYSPGKSS